MQFAQYRENSLSRPASDQNLRRPLLLRRSERHVWTVLLIATSTISHHLATTRTCAAITLTPTNASAIPGTPGTRPRTAPPRIRTMPNTIAITVYTAPFPRLWRRACSIVKRAPGWSDVKCRQPSQTLFKEFMYVPVSLDCPVLIGWPGLFSAPLAKDRIPSHSLQILGRT